MDKRLVWILYKKNVGNFVTGKLVTGKFAYYQ